MVAVAFQRLDLSSSIDDTAAHRGPLVATAVRLLCRILAMTVSNSILRHDIISIRVGLLIMLCCVSRVPIEHEIGGCNCAKHLGSFGPCCRISRTFIFENQNHILLGRSFSRISQFFVDGRAIRSLIVEPPEIEETYAIRMEGLGQLDTSFQHFILLLKRKIGVKLIALGAVLRLRCARPIHLEQRTGDVRHAQLVLSQYAPRFLDFLGVQLQQVLIPHAAQPDPFHAKFLRSHFAGSAKVLPYLVVDDRNPEWRFHGRVRGGVARERRERRRGGHHPKAGEKFTTRSVKRRYTGSSLPPIVPVILPKLTLLLASSGG